MIPPFPKGNLNVPNPAAEYLFRLQNSLFPPIYTWTPSVSGITPTAGIRGAILNLGTYFLIMISIPSGVSSDGMISIPIAPSFDSVAIVDISGVMRDAKISAGNYIINMPDFDTPGPVTVFGMLGGVK